MRKIVITFAALAAIVVSPTIATAQVNTAAGIAIGAGTGAIIAGPPGAIIGGIIGAGVGVTTEPRPVYYDPSPYPVRRCWVDEWGRRFCR
jgi:hypothetical protein